MPSRSCAFHTSPNRRTNASPSNAMVCLSLPVQIAVPDGMTPVDGQSSLALIGANLASEPPR
jgi:hypothetical protein